jgi:hypothetical protein
MLQKNTARSVANTRRQSSSQAERQVNNIARAQATARRQNILGQREQQPGKTTSSSRETQGRPAPRRLRLPSQNMQLLSR